MSAEALPPGPAVSTLNERFGKPTSKQLGRPVRSPWHSWTEGLDRATRALAAETERQILGYPEKGKADDEGG